MTPEQTIAAAIYTAVVVFWRVVGMPAIGAYLIYCVLMAIDRQGKKKNK